MIDKNLLAKKDEIVKLRNKLYDQGKQGKMQLEKWWYLNVLLLAGRHWVYFDKSKNSWENISFKDYKEYPVTNRFAVAYNVIKSVLTQKEPRIIVKPAFDAPESIATAEVADVVVDVVGEEAKMKTAREIAASWGVVCANAFFINYYEVDGEKYGERMVEFERCADCGSVWSPKDIADSGHKCPQCGGEQFAPAMDDFGKPIGERVPNGQLKCDIAPPFEMYFNNELQDFHNVTEVMRRQRVPISTLEALYPRLRNIAYVAQSGSQGGWLGGNGDVVRSGIRDYVWAMPCPEFPDGLMATMVGEDIVELSELQYDDREGRKFINVVHFGNERVPGRILHRCKLDDVAKKQIDRNKLEAYITLWIYTMTGGKILDPGCEMDEMTGDPNQHVTYTPGLNGAKPERWQGFPVDQSVYKRLEQMDQEINDLAGMLDVLRGEHPAGVQTLGEVQALMERAYSRHNEMIDNWERANEEVTRQQIEILRKFGTETRSKTFKNSMGSWETKQFTNADLNGGLTVQVEKGSSVPKSKAMEFVAITEDIKYGVINPQDPKVQYQILEKQGLTELASAVGEDIKDAMREWKDFADGKDARPRLGIDNEQIHYLDAVSRAKSDEFFMMDELRRKIWVEHVELHKRNIEAQLMQEAMAAGAQKPGAPSEKASMEVMA